MGDNEAAANAKNARTPLDAKRIGDKIITNSNWHNIKEGVMFEIL